MTKIEELQKRVEHLETEVELLKELVKLQSKLPERLTPIYPPTPINPYYERGPSLQPPYKVTCEKGEE